MTTHWYGDGCNEAHGSAQEPPIEAASSPAQPQQQAQGYPTIAAPAGAAPAQPEADVMRRELLSALAMAVRRLQTLAPDSHALKVAEGIWRKYAKGTDILRSPASAPAATEEGAALIAAERQRQIEVEGWTPEHDAVHTDGELVEAAIAYAVAAIGLTVSAEADWWPWDLEWWKPKDTRSNLIRAGALIAAELDRLALLPASPATTDAGAAESEGE